MKICHVVTNDVLNDPRVDRIAISLSRKYDVHILGLGGHRPTDFSKKPYSVTIVKRPSYAINEKRKKKIKKQLANKKSFIGKFLGDLVNYNIRKRNAKLMENQLKNIKADLYVANDLDTLPFVAKIAKRNKAKLIYDSHEFYVDSGVMNTRLFKKLFEIEERKYIKLADKVMTVNQSIAEEFYLKYKMKEKPEIIYNMPLIYKYSSHYTKNDDGKIHIVYTGIYAHGRGLGELILTMKNLPSNYILSMQGYGPLEEELRKIASINNLEKKVIFVEPVPMIEIVPSLARYDIGVVPYQPVHKTNYYCTPNKLFEYIHAGLAVVGSDVPEIKRFVDNYNIGQVFNPYDTEDMAKKIQAVAEELDKYKESSKKASKTLRWENEEKKLLKLYESVFY